MSKAVAYSPETRDMFVTYRKLGVPVAVLAYPSVAPSETTINRWLREDRECLVVASMATVCRMRHVPEQSPHMGCRCSGKGAI